MSSIAKTYEAVTKELNHLWADASKSFDSGMQNIAEKCDKLFDFFIKNCCNDDFDKTDLKITAKKITFIFLSALIAFNTLGLLFGSMGLARFVFSVSWKFFCQVVIQRSMNEGFVQSVFTSLREKQNRFPLWQDVSWENISELGSAIKMKIVR
jgi:hypothetical protein